MSPLAAVFEIVFPSACACCGRVLVHGERQVCVHCLTQFAETRYSPRPDNPVERLLTGRIDCIAATSLYHFRKGSTVQQAVHAMKFHRNPDLCLLMGRRMGLDLMQSGRFDDVDLLVPVPLHWLRWLQRGYNQSGLLCRGMSEAMHKPVAPRALLRHRHTRQQSLQRSAQRAANVEDAFRVRQAALLKGKHVLLVDDVLTTGDTLTACADALSSVPGLRLSVATFCAANG